jgi:hypothetical protein
MTYQNVFKRYELKFLLTQEQKQLILQAIKPYMALDKYGRTTIRNIYFDTSNFRLIRRSIEKPVYKEKLRIRSYYQVTKENPVFVELKKKHRSIVYKRRLSLPEEDAMAWICDRQPCPIDSQITNEINYFLDYYTDLHPAVFLSYEREAFYTYSGNDFRITFDENILCRQEDLSLQSEVYGDAILPPDSVLMEVKCSGGIPLWLQRVLSEQRIYKTSFSKYGTAYKQLIYPKQKEDHRYA